MMTASANGDEGNLVVLIAVSMLGLVFTAVVFWDIISVIVRRSRRTNGTDQRG